MLAALQKRIGHAFRDEGLLDRALTHGSAAAELGLEDNERLEFLGDAVLELVASDLLFRTHPEASEGELTQRRARLVSTRALSEIARRIELGPAIRLAQGERASGGANKNTVLANALEAVLAAVYLEGGLDGARQWMEPLLSEHEAGLAAPEVQDAKNRLQEALQGAGRPLPEYRTVATDGPAHALSFLVECTIEGELKGSGRGSTKRAAQRAAAREALSALGLEPPGGTGAVESSHGGPEDGGG